ncbi:hypothetical protein Agub_g531, partial [Astrephomene gubernaculifera]
MPSPNFSMVPARTACMELSPAVPDLPALALQVVGSFLPQRSVAACRLVCRQWRAAFTGSVQHVCIQVLLDPHLTDLQIAAAAAAFPAATSATLLLPNCAFAPFNPYDSAGAVTAARTALGRRSAAANEARRAALRAAAEQQQQQEQGQQQRRQQQHGTLAEAESARGAAAAGAEAARAPSTSPSPFPSLDPHDAGRAAVHAALQSLRNHLPGLQRLQIGDAQRPTPRPGPLAALAQCLPTPSFSCSTTPATPTAVQLLAVAHTSLPSAPAACSWSYPASLVPLEGAVGWAHHQQDVAQQAAEQAVAAAHRA